MKNNIVAFLFCLTSSIANAQAVPEFRQINKPVLCGPVTTLLQGLADPEVNEKPIWIGKNDDGRSDFIVFVNPKTQAFTVVQIGKEVGCIIGIGYKSQSIFNPT